MIGILEAFSIVNNGLSGNNSHKLTYMLIKTLQKMTMELMLKLNS